MLFLLAFHALSLYAHGDRKPPVTAVLIVANILFFLRPGRLDRLLPTISQVCLNPHLVLKDLDARRLFLSAFYHVDETHLVYNMLSLLWKGVQLEVNMGSLEFAKMVAVLLALSHGLVVVVAKGLASLDYPDALYSHCAIGFSAVLFALKVVLNWNSPTYTDVYGVLVPARHAAWAELILVQMFVPGTSFIGHLCGILAGLLYVHSPSILPAIYSSLYRLRHLVSWSAQILFRPCFPGRGRSVGQGFVDWRDDYLPDGSHASSQGIAAVWRCPLCTFDNGIYLDYCEMCNNSRPEMASTSPSAPPWPPAPSAPSMHDVRQARLARFGRS